MKTIWEKVFRYVVWGLVGSLGIMIALAFCTGCGEDGESNSPDVQFVSEMRVAMSTTGAYNHPTLDAWSLVQDEYESYWPTMAAFVHPVNLFSHGEPAGYAGININCSIIWAEDSSPPEGFFSRDGGADATG